MTLILASTPGKEGKPKDRDPAKARVSAKARVMAELARLVAEGRASMATLESGTLELRLSTGEVFHLGDKAVTRIL
jgi:hypothetical protein